jgi:hypothetical protein
MPSRGAAVALALVIVLLVAPAAFAQQGRPGAAAAGPLSSIEEKTADLQKLDGFFPLYWDADMGQMWMEIPMLDTDVLYVSGLSAGLGSNDIGLDRGQLGGGKLVRFERVGRKILMVQPNLRFRADSDNLDEVKAVEEAFAKSIIWGFVAAAETDGRVLVDMTDFLMRDAHGVAGRLQPAQYRLDRARSAMYMERTKNFPKNTEMDVTLTFVSSAGGGRGGFGGFGMQRGPGGGFGRGSLRAVTPSPEAVTVRQHHSIVELPGPGYEMRPYDARAGAFGLTYYDYAVPLGTSLTKRFIGRHRLHKVDPSAAVSDAVEPIVYYLDRGTPEPVRSALLDGARWWNQAYEAAGYRNAFQVEVMPEGADPLDVRYNVIQWVHRSTRGWSYGGSVTDPRTGEIIKGHVTLGSLRVRQDYMIAEGLLSPYENGTETPPELAEWALARLRQLSAHEVGHTIGFGHNYWASSMGRTSVMDYPHPLLTLVDGELDLSQVYDDRIGEWDKIAVTYAYQDFPAGADQSEELREILDRAWDRDLIYMSNQDMSVQPRVHQWANGDDPAAELDNMMEIRAWALDRFGENAIRLEQPLAELEEVLVPLYLRHRYQATATASTLGGMNYHYALRGDGHGTATDPVSADDQYAALDSLLATIAPDVLAVPRHILSLLPPRPSGYGSHREMFPRYTGMTFDAITPAVVAAQHVVSEIFAADRAARMVQQKALHPDLPGLDDVIDRTAGAVFMHAGELDDYEAEVARAIQRVVIEQIMALAASAPMPQVRAIAAAKLHMMAGHIQSSMEAAQEGAMDVTADQAHMAMIAMDIERMLDRDLEPAAMPRGLQAPPGAPIGQPAQSWVDPTMSMQLPPLNSVLDMLLPPDPACSREH